MFLIRSLTNRRNLILAVSAAVVLMLVTTLLWVVRGSDSHFRMTAQFDTAAGLYAGNSVDILGYPVGRIISVRPSGDHVDVELEVDEDVDIPRDAMAVVTRPGIVTDRRVELTPAYTSGPKLRSGAVLDVDRTRQPVEFDEVLGSINSLVAEMSEGGSLGTGVSQTAEFLEGRGAQIRSAIGSLARTSDFAADNVDDVTEIVTDLAVVARAVREHRASLKAFTTNLGRVTEDLSAESDHVIAALDSMEQSMETVTRFVKENREAAVATVDGAQTTVDTLAGRLRELQESIDLMPLAFKNVVDASDPDTSTLRVALDWQRTIIDTGTLQQLCTDSLAAVFCQIGLGLTTGLGLGAS